MRRKREVPRGRKQKNDLVKCKVCKRELKWGDAYMHSGPYINNPEERAWCSEECWAIQEKRNDTMRFLGDVILWIWMIVNPIIAIAGTVFIFYFFWPGVVSALVRIIPASIVMLILTMYLEGRIFNPSGGHDDGAGLFIWGVPCGIPYGVILVLSIVALIAITSYTGFSVWMKP